MIYKFPIVIGLLLMALLTGCIEKVKTGEEMIGDYLGLEPPEGAAEIFTPGIVSTGLNERDLTISPDGNEILYSVMAADRGVIIEVKREDGVWGHPAIAPFSGLYSDLEPCIAPDGSKLYFASKRPIESGGEEKDYDIWVCERTSGGWGEPVNLGAPINTPGNEFYPSVTSDGTIYFTAVYDGRGNADDIYRARMVNGVFDSVEILPEVINTMSYEYNAFIAPDESYLIYTAYGREGSLGRGDLFINYRFNDDSWSQPIPLGEGVNSSSHDFCPFVTRDGKCLFFTSNRSSLDLARLAPLTYEMLVSVLRGPGNGQQDIYWINAAFIDSLRPQ